MQRPVLHLLFSIVSSATLIFTGCAGKGSDAPGGSTVFDSTEKASPVTVNDPHHYLYFHPKVGDTYRYRIGLVSTSNAQTDDHLYKSFPPKEGASTVNSYYLKMTVKTVRPDSSVEFSLTFDSITIKLDRDTMHLNFSTNNPASKTDPRFSSFASLVNQPFGFLINKYGDVQEIYGTSPLVNTYMKTYPDSVNTPENREKVKQTVEGSIADYLSRAMVRFPEKPMGKDSTIVTSRELTVPIWQQIAIPMRLDAKTTMDGFSERGGKVLASFTTTSNVTPTKDGVEDPAAKATVSNMKAGVRENVLVEDATGMVVHREVTDARSWDFKLQAKAKPENYFQTHRESKDITTVDLLK